MKVLVDIPKEKYELLQMSVECGMGTFVDECVVNGKVLEDMANGEVVKAMFPTCEQKEHIQDGQFEMYFDNDLSNASYMRVTKDWWDKKWEE